MYTFTEEQLREFVTGILNKFNFSPHTIETTINESLRQLDKPIPFNGEPAPYEDEDNVIPEAVGADLWF